MRFTRYDSNARYKCIRQSQVKNILEGKKLNSIKLSILNEKNNEKFNLDFIYKWIR